MSEQGRIIGIRHRIKQTKEGQSKPTQVAVWDGKEKITNYNLADETAELEWVKGNTPVKWRAKTEEDDLSHFPEHHLKGKKGSEKVPAEYEGLQTGDTVVMVLGGSGDYLAFAISRHAEDIKAQIVRVPAIKLKEFRKEEDKDKDAQKLIELYQEHPYLFQKAARRERDFILLGVLYRSLTDAMKARIACGQRIDQAVIGSAFCNEDGFFPQGSIKKAAEEARANDVVYQSLQEEEARREKALTRHLKNMVVYLKLFEPIKGCGPRIASRLLVAIGDINRFQDSTNTNGKTSRGSAKLKAFCGVHVFEDGTFVRRRHGKIANWSNEARQALYLIVDQFIRRPDSEWGQRFLQIKANFRAKHPEVLCKTCSMPDNPVPWDDCAKNGHKRMYNDGHIHRMAIWRTASKFAEWLWKEWTRLEEKQAPKKAA